MSQNNETQQQTRIERVVVWEGEWAPVRRYFHHVLVLKDKIIKTSMDTVDSTAKALCETKTSLVKTTESTIHESLKWKDSNPALVIPAVSALVLFINRNPRIFVRNFVLASAFVSAALYPKIFVQAFYKPKEFLENSFVSYEKRAEERKAAQQALQTTTAAPTTTTTTTATETAVEKPPKEDSVLSEEESNEATNTAPPTIVEENKA
ncbi:hypothetical protein FDP41_003068 [Naegleria fowleri]|uniref:MICOS complex subunit n=1 Tax=Naegleria fowleri TaxID=5763 RepID=A0A6A5BRI7_NAEFO|nr:uncharacterized protein FDP41_003068 [Naegleria fowleri]KAF0977746.1 hypothetical protein FDP41_003068 [Naegleria fowleri]CAG4717808.1 unnamed protein product [Naegleria fowleri]